MTPPLSPDDLAGQSVGDVMMAFGFNRIERAWPAAAEAIRHLDDLVRDGEVSSQTSLWDVPLGDLVQDFVEATS